MLCAGFMPAHTSISASAASHARFNDELSGGRPGKTGMTMLTKQVTIRRFFDVRMTMAIFTCFELFPRFLEERFCGVARRCCGGVGVDVDNGRLSHNSKITVLQKVSR